MAKSKKAKRKASRKLGRPRLDVKRTPSGQPSRASSARPRPYGETLTPNISFRTLRVQALLGLSDPRMRYPVGLMSTMKDDKGQPLLSDAQVSAGLRFHEIVDAYNRETGFASPNARAQDISRTNGHPPDVVTAATTAAERNRNDIYVKLGGKVDALLTDLCVRELPPPWLERQRYIDALQMAAEIFGYASRKLVLTD